MTTTHTHPAPLGTTRHLGYINTCPVKGCKWTALSTGFGSVSCPTHDRRVSKRVIGTVSAKACDARCTNARGPLCECSCGGENHGAGH
jgi:hypothetical protein